MTYNSHSCPTPKRVDNQVPVCPLCNKPVPYNRGETPDIAVNAHIERDCQSDPAKSRRKVNTFTVLPVINDLLFNFYWSRL